MSPPVTIEARPMPAIRRRGCVARVSAAATFAAALVLATSGPAAAAPSPSRTGSAAARVAKADRAAVEAARRFLCPHGGRPMRGRCRGGAATAAVAAGDMSVRDWDAGLPAAVRRQAPCPDGTTQARVLFWDDAVRCVPR